MRKHRRGDDRVSLIPSFTMTRRERNRLILVVIALLVLWWILDNSMQALGPFIFGLVLAYLMMPLVDRLDRYMPRVLAILAIYLVFIGAVAAFVWWLTPIINREVRHLIDESPTYGQQLQQWSAGLLDWYNSLPLSDEVRQSIENAIRNSFNALAGLAQQAFLGTFRFVTQTVGAIVGFLIIPFWLFYVLLDKEKGIRAFTGLIPRNWRVDIWRVLRIINGILGSYIRGQLFLGLIVGIVSTVGMILVGAPFPFLLGLISGVTELIPVVGPILGAVPGLIFAAFHPEGWVMVLKVLAVYVIVQQLENNLLVPKVQGDSVKVHPAFIIVALVVGGQVAGLFGLIVAVPVAAILRDVYLYLYRRFAEGYSSKEAEDSVPSREDKRKPRERAEDKRKLVQERRDPGIDSHDEVLDRLEKEQQQSEGAREGAITEDKIEERRDPVRDVAGAPTGGNEER
jgi:predicted PurR-regulated permease PerM